MKRLIVVASALLVFLYPFAVYFGLRHFSAKYVALGLVFIFLLRFTVIGNRDKSLTKSQLFLITAAGIIIGLLGAIFDKVFIIKLYPVFINFMMLGIFFVSFLYPPTIIEKIAKIKEPNLPDEGIRYTRKVTFIWSVFFAINGSIALWTALFSTDKIWVFYNGFLSYILIGALFVTEFFYRQWAKRKSDISKR